MSKKLPLIVLATVIVLAGGAYYFNAGKTPLTDSPTDSTMTDQSAGSQLSELPNDWETYTSSEMGFSINRPPDVRAELTQEGVHFLKLGSTQATGTELFDGLSLMISTAKLQNTNFDEFVQKEYGKIKNEPVYESVSELTESQVSTYSGYSFTATGLGKGTTYFLKNGSDGYIKIVDMTVEPANENRDFHKTVTLMLNSLQIHTPAQ